MVVGAYFPYPAQSGWSTRVYQLVRRLATRYDVTVVAYASAEDDVDGLRGEVAVEPVRREPSSLLKRRVDQARSLASPMPSLCSDTHSREMQAAIDRVAARGPIDFVQLESTLPWAFRFPAHSRVLIDEHNIDFEVYDRMRESERSRVRRGFYRWEQMRFRRFEPRAWRAAAGVALTSEREVEIVARHAPGTPTAFVPNGVDVDYFAPQDLEPEPHTIVFNGVLDYRPNIDAVAWLVEEILPRVRAREPNARVQIVGRNAGPEVERLRGPAVELTGAVPDVRPYLQRAGVVSVPIRMGSGTRFKVVEGLAMARPMVSTTIGCEGIDVRHDEHLLIGDTAESFAAGILRLFDEAEVGDALGRRGRELIERRYSWEHAGDRLLSLYDTIAEHSGRRDSEQQPVR
jgi:glycosyltransferase involved in cell wall biosynthesis